MSTKITFVGLESDAELEALLSEASSESETPTATDGVVISIESIGAEWNDPYWDLTLIVKISASDDSLWDHWHYTLNSTFSESGEAGGYMVLGGGLSKSISSISPGAYSFSVVAVNSEHEAVSNIDITTIVLPSDGSSAVISDSVSIDGKETVSVNLESLASELGIESKELVEAIVASSSVDTDTSTGTPLVGGKTYYKNADTIVTSQVANSWFGGERWQPSSIGISKDDPKVIGIVHDGNLSLDGHAEKILLTNSANIRGKLPHVNLSAQGDPNGPSVFKSNIKSWPESEHVGKAIPEIDSITGRYYLDLSLVRSDMENIKSGAFEEHPSISTTLFEEISESQIEITLTDGAEFPSSGYIKIEDEYIFYTGKTGDDILTGCTRGLGSLTSTASPHLQGAVAKSVATIVRTSDDNYKDIILAASVDKRLDFVFGSSSLDYTSSSFGERNKLLFDKHKGAIRAGIVTSLDWNKSNRGNFSSAFGYNGYAKGMGTFIGGYDNYAETPCSAVFGSLNRVWEGADDEGVGNLSVASFSNSISGGEYNDIYNAYSSGILAGSINWMDFTRSSAIVSGEKNWIRGACDERVNYSFIGSGYENIINFSNGSGIVSGDRNIIGGESAGSFVGSGESNYIITNEDSTTSSGIDGVVDNRDKLIESNPDNPGTLSERWSCGDNDGLGREGRRREGRSLGSSYFGTSFNSSIVGGFENTIANSNYSFIGGGEENIILNSKSSTILGGDSNSIEPYILMSSDNPLEEKTFSILSSDSSVISGGSSNSIMAGASASAIAGGVGNSISESEVGFLFGKDNASRKTPITETVTRFTHTTGYAAKSNLYGQHSHASGGFYSDGSTLPLSTIGYSRNNPSDLRKLMGYSDINKTSSFMRTKDASNDSLLQKVINQESRDFSDEKEFGERTGSKKSDIVRAGQSKYPTSISKSSPDLSSDNIWNTNSNMIIGSAQTSVLTLRREVTFFDLASQDEQNLLFGDESKKINYSFSDVESFVTSDSGPKYLIFTRSLDRDEKGSHGKYQFDNWYHSTGGGSDDASLKDSSGNVISSGGDFSSRGSKAGLPRQYAKKQWFQVSDSYNSGKYKIPTISFMSFSWGWLDTLLSWTEELYPGTGGVRSHGGLNFESVLGRESLSAKDPYGNSVLSHINNGVKKITNAWSGNFNPDDGSVYSEDDSYVPNTISNVDISDRKITLGDTVTLHPVGPGTVISRKSNGTSIIITESDFDKATSGGDGYFYSNNSDGTYSFYYRCVDMNYDMKNPYPSKSELDGMADSKKRIERERLMRGESNDVVAVDTFEMIDDGDDRMIGKLVVALPDQDEYSGHGEFELYLSDPELAQVLEIDPYSVWAFSVTAVVTPHSTQYVSGGLEAASGSKRGVLRTAVMKACGGVSYPGLHNGDVGSSIDLSSAIVFSNDENGFDKTTYSAGAPQLGINTPIIVSKTSGRYMDNYMTNDEDPGFYLKIDAGSTSVPFGASSILPSHKDYLRLVIGTKVSCRVVARVELTQISGVESFVEDIDAIDAKTDIQKFSAGNTPSDALDKAVDEISDSTILSLEDFNISEVRSSVKDKAFEDLTSDEVKSLVSITDATRGAVLTTTPSSQDVTTGSVNNNFEQSSLGRVTQKQLESASLENSILSTGTVVSTSEYSQDISSDIDSSVETLSSNSNDNIDQSSQSSSANSYLDSKESNLY